MERAHCFEAGIFQTAWRCADDLTCVITINPDDGGSAGLQNVILIVMLMSLTLRDDLNAFICREAFRTCIAVPN
jgi:hypothetical protein